MNWRNITIAGLMLIMTGCSTDGPQAIRYGDEMCEHCKMTIMDDRFGAEMITPKGKVFKFDAVECMAGYTRTYLEVNKGEKIKVYVTDYAMPGKLVAGESAVYLSGDAIKSPMGGHLAAFENKENGAALQEETGAVWKSWEDLIK